MRTVGILLLVLGAWTSSAKAQLGVGDLDPNTLVQGVRFLGSQMWRKIRPKDPIPLEAEAPAPGADPELEELARSLEDLALRVVRDPKQAESPALKVQSLEPGLKVVARIPADILAQVSEPDLRLRMVVRGAPDSEALELPARALERGEDFLVLDFPSQSFQDHLETLGEGYTVFRTTESKDSLVYRQAFKSGKGALPKREVSFMTDSQVMRRLGEAPDTSPGNRSHLSGEEWVEHAGVLSVVVSLLSGNERIAQGHVLLPGRAEWMVFSGHYPYDSGGRLEGSQIRPETIPGASWKDHLEVLLFASCYAVSVQGYEDAEDLTFGKGLSGSAWWEKFRGTLLGYHGSAPSSGVDVNIARWFMAEVARRGLDPETEEGSVQMAKLWMDVNLNRAGASNASAIDKGGRYYYLRQSERTLRGVPVRGSYRWAEAEPEHWQGQNQRLAQMQEAMAPVSRALILELYREYGWNAPSFEVLYQSPKVQEALAKLGPEIPQEAAREILAKRLEYHDHIVFDVPFVSNYRKGIQWLMDRAGDPSAVTVDQVLAHFTPKRPRTQARQLPRAEVETLLAEMQAAQGARTPPAEVAPSPSPSPSPSSGSEPQNPPSPARGSWLDAVGGWFRRR